MDRVLTFHSIEAEAYRSNGISRKRLKCNATNRSSFRLGRAGVLILGGFLAARRFLLELNHCAKNPRSGLGAETRLKCGVRDAGYDPCDGVVDPRLDTPVFSQGTGDVDR